MEQLEIAVKVQKKLTDELDEQNLLNVKREISENDNFNLTTLFKYLVELCATAKKAGDTNDRRGGQCNE